MKNTNHYLRPLGLFLLLFLIPIWSFGQNITVQGVVKDASGESIIGASVYETGTTNGTITDFDGKFSLTVSPQGKLTISYIGYQTQTIEVASQTQFDIILKEDTKLLDEVVVVGYGTQRKEAVTGSVASMQGDILRDVPSGNVTSALQGRLPGVQMQQANSRPGADMQIRIRGGAFAECNKRSTYRVRWNPVCRISFGYYAK